MLWWYLLSCSDEHRKFFTDGDSAYATKASVTAAERAGTKVFSTVPRAEQLKKHGKDPHEKQLGDTDEYAEFRARMADPANQEIYKQRPSIANQPSRSTPPEANSHKIPLAAHSKPRLGNRFTA